MDKKKVFIFTNQAAFNLFGGVENQIINTVSTINASSDAYSITFFNMWNDDVRDCDIFHIVGLYYVTRELELIIPLLKNSGVKIVISPKFFYYPGLSSLLGAPSYYKQLEQVFFKMRNILPTHGVLSLFDPFYQFEHCLHSADMIITNSKKEEEAISHLFPSLESSFQLVHNAVDPSFSQGESSLFKNKTGLDDFILYLGRIELIKNVHGLIEAFTSSDLDTKLVIIGRKKDEAYYERCRNLSDDSVVFLDALPHDSELLRSAYADAHVVAQPSFFETCGQVGLEAGLSGANVVITKYGGTTEYFKDFAWYVDPMDVDDISDKLEKAYSSPTLSLRMNQ